MKRKMPQIKQVMTTFPYTIDSTATIAEAREMMVEHGIRHLPVTTEHHAIYGLISERDISVVDCLGAAVVDSAKFTVRELCAKEPYTVDSHDTVAKVALDMAERHLSAAIVTHSGKLAGIFTLNDVCRVLGEHLHELYGGGGEPEAA